MDLQEITRLRLHNQNLSHPASGQPAGVVCWLGAVQAQDFAAAKWALGLRLPGSTDAAVEQAFTAGAFLRTHLMRPTWHFVAPQDVRWLLALTAPRVHTANGSMYRQSGLDPAVISRSHAALANALQGDQHRTRAELAGVLAQAGILADGFRLSYLMMAAELDGILCSGPRRGKQFTYALLEERVPPAPPLTREEALAELTRRYFTSHGPATPRDFAWWSGLTMAEVKAGLEIARADLSSREVDGQVHWFVPTSAAADLPSPTAHLLPNYDEYGIGYKDHSAILEDPGYIHFFDPLQHAVYAHPFLMDGKVAGTWKRTVKKDSVEIEALSFKPPGEAEIQALSDAAGRYGQFMELPVTLSVQRVVRRE